MDFIQNLNQYIKKTALKYNFVACGLVPISPVNDLNVDFTNNWIRDKRHAGMDWFLRNQELRYNPSLLVDNVQSMVVLISQYNPVVVKDDNNNIASYAHNIDYHFTVKDDLNKIIDEIKLEYGEEITARCFTDSAPIMERYWANKAGLGWIGKSGMLINKEFGSYIIISEILLSAKSDIYDIESDFNGCGTCDKCITNCPSNAILEDKSIDSRKCLSYLTIEHKGDFSSEQKDIIKASRSKYVYGCDECLRCCPWNSKHLKNSVEPSVFANQNLELMSNSDFRRMYKSTPLERVGLKALKRNFEVI